MFNVYKKLWNLLNKDERRNGIFLLLMMMIMGLLEVAGVASIMPFISVITNSEIIHNNSYLSYAYETLRFSSERSFLLFLGVSVFGIIVGSQAFKAATFWTLARYTHMRSYSIGSRLMYSYLNRDYCWFLNHHTADLGKSILSEVQEVVTQVLVPAVQLIASAIIAICLMALIVFVDPIVAITATSVLGGVYVFIYLVIRKQIGRIGKDRVTANKARFKIAQDVFSGIKEVKLYGLEDHSINKFRKPAMRFSRSIANNQIIGQIPRFILEAIAFGGLIIIILIQLSSGEDNALDVLPIVTLYALAGYRLMPALQQLYQSASKIRFGAHALDSLYMDFEQTEQDKQINDINNKHEKISPKHNIRIENVTYTYPGAQTPSLENFSLTIPVQKTTALVGGTGAGKTTAVDIILGLLRPQIGALVIDQDEITDDRLRVWQRSVGYVPQHIFLVDDTVASNIAFGVADSQIDMAAVEAAAKLARIHDFIVSEMPNGYRSKVGERGVRLSGGQRQRLGIARALYHDPDVIILDEATSALDNITEKAVMDAVNELGKKKTIIMIAHRMSTVRKCDELHILEKGKIIASGTFEKLLAENAQFQEMVNN